MQKKTNKQKTNKQKQKQKTKHKKFSSISDDLLMKNQYKHPQSVRCRYHEDRNTVWTTKDTPVFL